MNWATICYDKRDGGLGVRSLSITLLCKWIWHFANERDSLLRKVICGTFGEDRGGWCSREVRGAFGTGVWKEIRKE